MGTNISIIIPTLNAEKDLPDLLRSLSEQDIKCMEIIIVDSSSTDHTIEIAQRFKNVDIIPIARNEFDHGKTRDMALQKSKGDIVVFMTQDAVPAGKEFISKLTAPLEDPTIAVSTGRQLPKADASRMERLVREFNYPDQSHVRTKEDIPQMGIKTFFCSDVCAAYNKEIYLSLGGFEYPLKTNEDMFYAAKAISNGYKIAYVADAMVYHSHNLNLKEQYKRNYIQGYEMEKHKELLNNVSQETEGMKLVKFVSKELLKKGQFISFIHFGLDCCARLLGSKAGKKAADNE